MNPGPQPLTIRPGETVGRYLAAKDIQVLNPEERDPVQVKVLDNAQLAEDISQGCEAIPEHLLFLYQQGKNQCKSTTQLQQFLSLLTRYSDVFSSGEKDVGHTTLIEHSIPTIRDTKTVRLPPHRLGP